MTTLLADLEERVTGRRATATGRAAATGKTSALRRLAADLTETSTVCVDRYEATSMADLVLRIDEVRATHRPSQISVRFKWAADSRNPVPRPSARSATSGDPAWRTTSGHDGRGG